MALRPDRPGAAGAGRGWQWVFSHSLGGTTYRFADLRTLLAKATPLRSGDALAGLAAADAAERVAARMALADLPLSHFLNEAVIPFEDDEVTRLIVEQHDFAAFAPVEQPHRRRLPRMAAVGRRRLPRRSRRWRPA